MVFRRSTAHVSTEQWITQCREKLAKAKETLEQMLHEPALRGTIRKDRLETARIFSELARVMESKSTEGTIFSEEYYIKHAATKEAA